LPEYSRKVCICGDPGVGKTSLVRRFVVGKYDDKYISTLGTVISKKSVTLPRRDSTLSMLIWDISGQTEFKRIHMAAFSNATGGIAVCDITRKETVEHIKDWITTFRGHAGNDVPMVVLANKMDLLPQPLNKAKVAESLASFGLPVYATSAKSGAFVEEAFWSLADQIMERNGALARPDKVVPMGEMPEKFETPTELLDYMATSFCSSIKDEEMGMHMLRKQVADQGIDFQSLRKKDAENLADRLGELVKNFKGNQDATRLKTNMVRAIERTKW
jgi:small GTP-binding protein